MKPFSYVDELHLEVTSSCNQKCAYCFIGETPPPSIRQLEFMTQDVAIAAIETVCRHTSCNKLILTFHGGEPLLQDARWFDRVCSEAMIVARKHNVLLTTSMQSNASLLNEEHLRTFTKYKLKVGVSLDGLEEQHNAVRGNFTSTVNNIMLLKREGLLGGIITVLTTVNHEHIGEFLHFLLAKGISNVSFNDYYAVGRGRGYLALRGDQLFLAWRTILAFMLEYRRGGIRDRLTLYRLQRFMHPPGRLFYRLNLNCNNPFCHAGIKMIHVAANGDIFPCGSSSWVVEKNESFKLGNIKDKIALTEWKSRLFELHKKSPKYESECAVCNAAQICSFGCSAFEKVDKGGFANICEATKLFYNLLKTFNAESLLELLKSEQA